MTTENNNEWDEYSPKFIELCKKFVGSGSERRNEVDSELKKLSEEYPKIFQDEKNIKFMNSTLSWILKG